MGYAVREVNGNSYVVAGGTDYYFNWHWSIQSSIATTNIHLFKTDINGVLQWERIISKPGTRMIARWMEPTIDGGFIITGFSNKDVIWPPDSNDVVLVKTDANGFVAWSKTYDTGKDDLAFCVQQTSDSGYIVSGFHDALPVSLAFNTYLQLIKTDALGIVQWEKKYQFAVRDFNTHEPFSYVVKQTSDGGFIAVGTNAVTHPADVEVLRTDAAGNVVWAKTYEHDLTVWRNSVGLDVIETSTGDFVIAGSMDKDTPLHLNYPYFLRLDNNGNVMKQRFFETLPVLNFQSGFSSVEETTDGGFFFTGMGGYSDFGDQAQLLRTSPSLDMIWSRVYTWDGMATVGSMSGRQTSDGGYVFAGKRQMAGSMLMKTNGIGMVACKLSNSLIEFTPSVAVSSWNPTVISGLNTSNSLLTVASPLVDTAIVCPVTVPSLPVELIRLSAEKIKEDVNVTWATSSEINCDYFVVERSDDANAFEKVGIVKGSGNSYSENNYVFTDRNNMSSAVVYYRLRQLDFDGAEHLSPLVAVKAEPALNLPGYFADHEKQSVNIFINKGNGTAAEYIFTDAFGKVISSGSITLPGFSSLSLDMSKISQGIYFFRISDESEVRVLKISY